MRNLLFAWLLVVLLGGFATAMTTFDISGTFFNVSNIHDLWEIIGAIATTIGVGLAIHGFSSWKIQIGATSDHELARRVVVNLRKYRVAVIAAWHAAESSAVQIQSKTWIGDGGDDNFLIPIYQARITAAEQARSDLEAIAIESAAIWHGVFETGFDRLYLIDQKCCNCIGAYLSLLIRGTYDEVSMTRADMALRSWSEFEKNGVTDDKSIRELFDSSCADLNVELNVRLLRGRS